MKKQNIIAVCLLLSTLGAQAQIISTIAGNGTMGDGGDNGPATMGQLNYPTGIAVDTAGNVYIADEHNSDIRKVSTSGIITRFAGNGSIVSSGNGGMATAAGFGNPGGIAIDATGNMFVVDPPNVREILTSGIVTAFMPGSFSNPTDLAIDGRGNVYVADAGSNTIIKISISVAITVTTIAGNGTAGFSGDGLSATLAQLNVPVGVAVDAAGNVYIAEQNNKRIRKVNTLGIITTIAGTGTGGYNGDGIAATSAEIYPSDVKVDALGNVYIVDISNQRIRVVNTSGIISTYAGNGTAGFSGDGGAATAAELSAPAVVSIDGSNNLYIGDIGDYRVRKVSASSEPSIVKNISGKSLVTVYPNPVQGDFMLNVSSPADELVQITLTNLAGEKVKEISTSTNTLIDVPFNSPPGIYFLFATTANEKLCTKIVK